MAWVKANPVFDGLRYRAAVSSHPAKNGATPGRSIMLQWCAQGTNKPRNSTELPPEGGTTKQRTPVHNPFCFTANILPPMLIVAERPPGPGFVATT